MKNLETTLLKRCPLFSGLSDEDLRRVRAISILRQVQKKEILFSEGEEARGFYVILSGKVKLYKISPQGKEQILHIVSAPYTFAEAALFLQGGYPAFAETLTDCRLLYIPKRDFKQLVERNPQLSLNMIVSLSNYLRLFVSLVEELSLKEVSSRVAKYLIDLSTKAVREGRNPNELELDLSKHQLAAKLGTISETLSRTFGKMKSKGLISVQGNKILIRDRNSLEEIASGLKV